MGGARWTYSRQDFHVNPIVSLDREEEIQITVRSGRRCCERYTRYSPLGSLARMFMESSRWFSPAKRLIWDAQAIFLRRITYIERNSGIQSTTSVKVLNVKDIPSSRLLFQLVPLERPTDGIEYGFSQSVMLPTVQTQGMKRCNAQGKTEFMPLKMLPTPTSIDSGSGCINKSRSPNASERPTLAMSAKMNLLPTPTMRDWKSSVSPKGMMRKNGKTRNDVLSNIPVMLGQHCQQTRGRTSQLNPLFVAEMMSFPLDWLVSPFLDGDKNP